MGRLKIEHSIFYRGFETHTKWGPQTPQQVELVLKLLALSYRGVVVSDSDLNNFQVFSQMFGTPAERVFLDAIETGFLRRAVRLVPQQTAAPAPISQQELFSTFKTNSPELARHIPAGHPKKLDKILDKAEHLYPALTWSGDKLAWIFGTRLLASLRLAQLTALAEKEYAGKLIRYILGLKDISTLRGAQLQKEVLPRWSTSPPQRRLWNIVLQAYTSNLPYAFDNRLMLAEPAFDNDTIIPGGPDSDEDELDFATDFYAALVSGRTQESFTIEEREVEMNEPSPHLWSIDLEKLLKLNLHQIHELREKAAPDKYFDLRFQSLASSRSMSDNIRDLGESRNFYADSLASAGKILSLAALEAEERNIREILIARRSVDERKADMPSAFKTAASVWSNLMFGPAGNLIVTTAIALLDITSLGRKLRSRWMGRKRKGELANSVERDLALVAEHSLKRPDYEVLKKFNEKLQLK